MEEFAERFYRGDYKLDFKAFSISCTRDRVKSTLGHLLTWSLNEFMIVKADKESANRFHCASECLSWITHAFGVGVIVETESLTTKYEKCEEYNKQLKEEYDELNEKYLQLKKENDGLHMIVDRFSSVGEVET